MRIFKNRRMVEHLTLELSSEKSKNEKLKTEHNVLKEYIKELENASATYKAMFLKQCELNENLQTKLKEYKTSNSILEEQLIEKNNQLEISESKRRELVAKTDGLTKEKNKLKKDLDSAREIIKKENKLNFIYKNRKDVKEYGKLKNERN